MWYARGWLSMLCQVFFSKPQIALHTPCQTMGSLVAPLPAPSNALVVIWLRFYSYAALCSWWESSLHWKLSFVPLMLFGCGSTACAQLPCRACIATVSQESELWKLKTGEQKNKMFQTVLIHPGGMPAKCTCATPYFRWAPPKKICSQQFHSVDLGLSSRVHVARGAIEI